jgi:hypothetical protein
MRCSGVVFDEATGERQGVAVGSWDTMAMEVHEVGREADGVKAPVVGRLWAAHPVPLEREPEVHEEVTVVCRVNGRRVNEAGQVVIGLDPQSAVIG